MTHEDDRDLREAFAAARRQDRRDAPAFARVRGGARQGSREDQLVVPLAVALGLAALALVAVLRPRTVAPPPAVPSITDWRSPTESLLQTPGREVLWMLPALGRGLPDYSHALEPGGTSPPTKRRRSS